MLVNITKLALNASIFRVNTVMDGKCISRTVKQSCLSPKALDIIQDNGSSSLTIEGKTSGYSTCIKNVCVILRNALTSPSHSNVAILITKHIFRTCWSKSQLSAGYIGISSPPEVITHSTPDIVVANLYSTLAWVTSTTKPDITLDTTYRKN